MSFRLLGHKKVRFASGVKRPLLVFRKRNVVPFAGVLKRGFLLAALDREGG